MKSTRLFSIVISAVLILSILFAISVDAASIKRSSVTIPGGIYTKGYSLYANGGWYWDNCWNWANVSSISDFFDPDGNYCIAYEDGSSVKIVTLEGGETVIKNLSIKKPMSIIGGVTCDNSGNLYIACGQSDQSGKGNIVTFAIYKYNSAGKYVGKAEHVAKDNYWDTKIPFDAGNCAMTFNGNHLICSYAKEMYTGHQANAVFSVDTTTMQQIKDYDCYSSHSFNQCAITLSDGGVAFANHGDAYPRGMQLVISRPGKNGKRTNTETVPIHFDGASGDNVTNAKLTGIAELSTGIAMVGAVGDQKASTANQELFMKILNANTGNSALKGGGTRSGLCAGEKYSDTGIVWLTKYGNNYGIGCAATVALNKNKLLVLWEKTTPDGAFLESYYSIVGSNGKILVNSVSLNGARINPTEELKYRDGFVYWTFADGQGYADVYKLNVSGLL